MANLSLFLPILLLAMFAKEGESVRCWVCSTDISAMCADPFFPVGRGGNSYNFPLENCDASAGATYPFLTSSKSACKKHTKYVNGVMVVSRGCTWKRQDDYSNVCPSTSSGPNEVNAYCQTCDYDGCNGASAIGMTLALITAPLALLLFK